MSSAGDYLDKYLKQNKICAICNSEMAPENYWVINTSQGVKVIHGECFKKMQISGCYAQVEILYKPGK